MYIVVARENVPRQRIGGELFSPTGVGKPEALALTEIY